MNPFSPRVLVVTLFLSLLVVGAVWLFPLWHMPGPLSLAHAAFEGQCSLCHQSWQGLNVDGCLSCHKVIAEARASGQGVHGTDPRPCGDCHAEHRGREAYIVPTSRGFVVADSCMNCHSNRNLLESSASAEAQAQQVLCKG